MGKILWKRKWQPTPVLLPGKSHGWRSLVGYSPWGRKGSDMTEQLHLILVSILFSQIIPPSLSPHSPKVCSLHLCLFYSLAYRIIIQLSSVTQSCLTLWNPMNCITNSQSSLKLTSIYSVMPSSHLILCCPLLLLPPIPPSIRVFSNETTLHMRWPK